MSKIYYIDGRVCVPGNNAGFVNLQDPKSLNKIIAETVGLSLPLPVYSLDTILTLGSITGGTDIEVSNGDVIKAVNGGGQLNLRAGTDNFVELTSDNGAFAESYSALYDTYQSTGFAGNYSNADAEGVRSRVSTAASFSYMAPIESGIDLVANIGTLAYGVAVASNAGGTVSFTPENNSAVSINSGITANPTVFTAAISNSAAIGGVGITPKTANTAYVNQVSFQESTVLFDAVLKSGTITADREYTLPNTTGTILVQRTASTAATTATDGDVLFVTAGGAAVVVGLPSAVVSNQRIVIKKVDAGVGAVDVTAAGIETIDGAATYQLAAQYDFVTVVSNGTEWFVVGNN